MDQKKKCTFWLTGLPSSGKTTLGGLLKLWLDDNGLPVAMIDGDEVCHTFMVKCFRV